MAAWGSSRGNKLGYQIFTYFLKYSGLSPTYFLLRIVTIYYIFFPGKAGRHIRYFYNQRLGFSSMKSLRYMYENFNYLGKSIIDKLAIMSGSASKYEVEHLGQKNIEQLIQQGQGGLLVSAHLGNWEGAGHLLQFYNTKINIVMYDGEQEKIKEFLEQVKNKSFNVIFIRDTMSHIYEINEAIQRNELICIHADRYVEGNKTIKGTLLGKEADFPIGPFVLATSFQVPVSFVFAMKKSKHVFSFYASKSKIYPKGREGINTMLQDYLQAIEQKIHSYPLQWHNYFSFWDEEKKQSDR
ncbi:MAG: lipid A biosynthesis acyltransferase [Chitinophagaceae bacterium]